MRNYNLSMLLLLPLVNPKITSKSELLDGYEDAIIDGFNCDINKPYLDNHIHIVVETAKFKSEHVSPIFGLDETESVAHYRLSGIWTLSYAIKIDKDYESEYKLIIEGNVHLLPKEIKLRILKFWGAMVTDNLFKILFEDNKKIDISKEFVMEEDYVEETLFEEMPFDERE